MNISKDDLAGYTDEELTLLGQMVMQEQERRRATAIYIDETLPPADETAEGEQMVMGAWQQPQGAHDAYPVGAIVSFNGAVWESLIPANVWSPSAYPRGWRKLGADDPAEGKDTPQWVQPTGAHDAYHKGSQVTFNGAVYESTIDNNTWSPTAYPAGWKKVAVS